MVSTRYNSSAIVGGDARSRRSHDSLVGAIKASCTGGGGKAMNLVDETEVRLYSSLAMAALFHPWF
jgi:hypothetical protein